MRLALSLVGCLLGSTALADTIVTRADVEAATVYAGQADITRSAQVAVPAGDHRLLIAVPDAGALDLPLVTAGEGVTLGPVTVERGVPIAEGALDTPAQAAARAARDAVRDALQEVQDRIALADAAVRAGTLQITHLEAIAQGGESGATMPEPGQLAARLETLGAEMRRAVAEVQAAQIARRDLDEALQARQEEVQEAEFALRALKPYGPSIDALAVDLTAGSATEARIEVSHASSGIGWQPSYEMVLDSETGVLEIARHIELSVGTGEIWTGVDVTFSAEDPNRVREPDLPFPDPARIVEPQPEPRDQLSREATGGFGLMSPAPVMEMDSRASVQITGLSLRYDYDEPVSVGASGTALLPFDPLTFDTDLRQVAVPRLNRTAFLVADLLNDSGEPILPGRVRYHRDGALIGEGFLDLIPAGAEVDLAFGPLDHLQLTWIDRSLAEGDRGVFVQSSTQERRIAFTIENTSDTAEDVQVLYALPFAEQEALDLTVTLSEQPDTRDWEDRRGVAEWQMTLDPGEERTVEMRFRFDWPEGQRLIWQP